MSTMEYKGDVGLYLSGAQVPIKQCGFYITPPTIKQIAQFGEDDFLVGVKMMSADRMIMNKLKDAQPDLKNVDDFQLLMMLFNSDEQFKQQVINFMEFICPDYEVEVAKNSINFRQGDDNMVKGQINPFTFEYFSNILKELFWPPAKAEAEYNPVNEKAEEIARKLEHGRAIANKDKGSASGEKGSLYAIYISVLSVGMCLDMNTLYQYTPFQLYDVFNRYTMKNQYDFYMKIKTTPMMSVEDMDEPEYWMSNMYRIETDE